MKNKKAREAAHRYQPEDLFANDALMNAKEWVLGAAGTTPGAICPVCERINKIYPRRIGRPMISDLQRLNALGPGFHHYKQFQKSGDFAKFEHISLIEGAENNDEAKKTSGYWMITEPGKAFLCGVLKIPERLIIYQDTLVRVDGDNKLVNELWPEFNYTELMDDPV